MRNDEQGLIVKWEFRIKQKHRDSPGHVLKLFSSLFVSRQGEQ